jgi:hypothetical protein
MESLGTPISQRRLAASSPASGGAGSAPLAARQMLDLLLDGEDALLSVRWAAHLLFQPLRSCDRPQTAKGIMSRSTPMRMQPTVW